jgi:hypothetical protein
LELLLDHLQLLWWHVLDDLLYLLDLPGRHVENALVWLWYWR